MEQECYHTIANLLSENKLEQAFSLMNQCIEHAELSAFFVSISAQYNRTKDAFNLGIITWEQYDLSNSQIINKSLNLAELLCTYKELVESVREKRPPSKEAIKKALLLKSIDEPKREYKRGFWSEFDKKFVNPMTGAGDVLKKYIKNKYFELIEEIDQYNS